MRALKTGVWFRSRLACSLLVTLVPACDGSSHSPVSPTTATPLEVLQPPVNSRNPNAANLSITFTPDPVAGSPLLCGGAFWGAQTPTWSMTESITETQGVGFTLKLLTYRYYNQHGALVFAINFPDNHYFPPYDEHVEPGCVALQGFPSGAFEEIVEGVDDNGNQLTFAGQVKLLPVPK
jgi:hypothetical protein